ncbi:nucleotidyltransferase family protein [Neobacillus sp. SM06]|uniref:nucleotidyltransferase family protein n=1 Tax=Neobacillus sp. SM06 TaxID=3422492 RepID=UPI003D2CACF1
MLNEETIISIIKDDQWMMEILQSVRSLNLPDWWICAGFVRSKIWDALHHFTERTPLPDVDVIYFAPANTDEFAEKKLEKELEFLMPHVPWSVKNEARMHVKSKMSPYSSAVDAISKFPETATALGVKLDEKKQVIITVPWGIDDLVNLKVKPTPFFTETKERAAIYEDRITKKNWKETWNKLKIYHIHDFISK